MYKLLYDEVNQSIIQVDPNGNETVIADDLPSIPLFSPDGKYAIYISPLEWECVGSLYLYNLENGQIAEVIPPTDAVNPDIPKYSIWINNEEIAVIIGFSMGTIEVGGNVFSYNIKSKKLKKMTEYGPEIQITKLEKLDADHLKLVGIEYTDHELNHFKEYNTVIELT